MNILIDFANADNREWGHLLEYEKLFKMMVSVIKHQSG